VPDAMDLISNEENKKLLTFLMDYLVYIRPFMAPPGIPADRLRALQDAFAATLKDPEALAEAERTGVEVHYVSPTRVQEVLSQIFDAPEVIKKRALDELRKAGWEGLSN
jgi:tripartite-type tricarboxylate transporter receptor subunit TctC